MVLFGSVLNCEYLRRVSVWSRSRNSVKLCARVRLLLLLLPLLLLLLLLLFIRAPLRLPLWGTKGPWPAACEQLTGMEQHFLLWFNCVHNHNMSKIILKQCGAPRVSVAAGAEWRCQASWWLGWCTALELEPKMAVPAVEVDVDDAAVVAVILYMSMIYDILY